MWLFAGFLALPLIEIALLVTVGAMLGLWLTLAIVIGTGIAGVMVIRWQGLHAMQELRQAGRLRRDPLALVAGNALLVLAGVLLILPGFLTDTVGLLLLLAPVRRLVIQAVSARTQIYAAGLGSRPMGPRPDGPRRNGSDVIDGEFFEIEQDQSDGPPNGSPPSGWTRH